VHLGESMHRDERDENATDDDATDNNELAEHFQDMSEMDMEGFLEDAIETYAEHQQMPELQLLDSAVQARGPPHPGPWPGDLRR
jgi:hypothetical protein